MEGCGLVWSGEDWQGNYINILVWHVPDGHGWTGRGKALSGLELHGVVGKGRDIMKKEDWGQTKKAYCPHCKYFGLDCLPDEENFNDPCDLFEVIKTLEAVYN